MTSGCCVTLMECQHTQIELPVVIRPSVLKHFLSAKLIDLKSFSVGKPEVCFHHKAVAFSLDSVRCLNKIKFKGTL